MTVAIAAICDYLTTPMVVAAEDRMVTAGDIEFEQPQPKGWQFGERCIALMYGEIDAQGAISNNVWYEVRDKKLASIADIAECYGRHLRAYIRRRAENDVLAPLGLTADSFMATHTTMSPALVQSIQDRLQNYYWSSDLYRDLGGALVIGTDAAGAHIYRVEHSQVDYMTGIGFVAAGSGKRHAESQFMFAGFTRAWTLPDTLALVHRAKKRAEVAPGVGKQSDIVAITRTPPYIFHFRHDSPLTLTLENLYRQAEEKHTIAIAEEAKAVRAVFEAQQAKQQATQAAQSPGPVPAQPTVGETVVAEQKEGTQK